MRHLLFLFLLFPLLVSAQPREDGYVHDVIYPLQINEISKNKAWTLEGNAANYSVSANVVTELKGAKYQTTHLTFSIYNKEYTTDEKAYNGIVTTASRGIPRSITINYTRNQKDIGFQIYSKEAPFTETSNLYAGSIGNPTAILLFQEETSATFELTDNKPYIGIKPQGNVYISSIDIAWQQTSYSRPDLVKDDLGTLCLPYSASSFSGFTPYTIKGKTVDGAGQIESIVFEESKNIVAGEPYVFVANGTEINIELSGERAITTAGHHNGLYGTFVDYPFASDNDFRENDHDYLVINADNCFQAASAKSGVRANRAFIKVKDIPLLSGANSQGRQLVLTAEGYKVGNGTPTSISNSIAPPSSNEVYSIDGRRANGSAVPALRISNGRKELRPATH